MPTPIEKLLIVSGQTTAVAEITLGRHDIAIKLAAWEDLGRQRVATFANARLLYVEADPSDADGLSLPWDIIGVESDAIGGNRWRFVLNCGDIEVGFEAEWPVVVESVG